jgi:hypothetical protein
VEGGVVRGHYILRGGGPENFSALKVPSQCPTILLVKIRFTGGKVLGCKEVKALGSGLCYE